MSSLPLGAHWHPDSGATTFALWSARAAAVELLLLDQRGAVRARHPMPRDGEVFAARVDGVGPGDGYAFSVRGPDEPAPGDAFDPSLPLLDPYARAISGPADFERRPWSVVVDPAFDWGDDRPPRVPWSDTLVYECHVKGLTAAHPDVAQELRGTYLGLCAEPVLDHLRALGVTAVELLPVHHRLVERHLSQAGRDNYWGYCSIGFFAPDSRFATGADGRQVRECKEMVRRLHAAGFEVILDVVYNHTGEGDRTGATQCFRGVDNKSYYRHQRRHPDHYRDFTGCGNTLDTTQPQVRQLVLDSLRYWVEEMHVDGFRFDLAVALARAAERHGMAFEPDGAFFQALREQPWLDGVKLIVEPWDLGKDGFQQGAFPAPWAEWNSLFRDGVRRVWRGHDHLVADFATRLAGSSDVVGARGVHASVHYVACHDGFTTADVVAYEQKHNQANGHKNKDGNDHNHSCNWGVEGPTDDAAIRAVRATVQRSLLLTVACAAGVPMLLGGDELGRTQGGNNNAYCLDDERTWLDWRLDDDRRALLGFVRDAFALRRASRLLRDGGDYEWLRPDGTAMQQQDWEAPDARALAMAVRDAGEPAAARLLLANAGAEPLWFQWPEAGDGGRWGLRLSSQQPAPEPRDGGLELGAHALAVLAWEASS